MTCGQARRFREQDPRTLTLAEAAATGQHIASCPECRLLHETSVANARSRMTAQELADAQSAARRFVARLESDPECS